MGGKRTKIKQVLKSIFRVRSWKLILILIPLLFLAATLLQVDHVGMIELRDAVIAADEDGDEEELARALLALQEYTMSHIVVNRVEENGVEQIVFGTGPFYLEQQYYRKAQEELERAERMLDGTDENPHGNVFVKAAAVCDALGRRYGWRYPDRPYIDCMVSELAKFPEMDEITDFQQAMIPPTALYRRDFASPVWTFSWTGLVVLTCVLLIVVILIRFVIWIILRITLLFLKKR